jgi:hypothetical protein
MFFIGISNPTDSKIKFTHKKICILFLIFFVYSWLYSFGTRTPIQLSIWSPKYALFSEPSVFGLYFGLLYTKSEEVYELQVFPVVGVVEENSYGIQLGGFAAKSEDTYGVQFGGIFCNTGDKLQGIQLSAWINFVSSYSGGLQIGNINISKELHGCQFGVLLNEAKELSGAQIGILNKADEVNRLQIGIVNYTDKLKGIQIGGINIAANINCLL